MQFVTVPPVSGQQFGLVGHRDSLVVYVFVQFVRLCPETLMVSRANKTLSIRYNNEQGCSNSEGWSN